MDRGKYLRELETEHSKIGILFQELASFLKRHEVDELGALWEKLEKLKEVLVEHVHSEDTVFYRDLRNEAAKQDQDALLPALDLFMKSMHEVSEGAVKFFEDFRSEAAIRKNPGEFFKRLETLRDEILKRIRSEEGTLFYIYRAYFLD